MAQPTFDRAKGEAAGEWESGVLGGLERLAGDPRRPFDGWAGFVRDGRPRAPTRALGREVRFDVCVEFGCAPRLA